MVLTFIKYVKTMRQIVQIFVAFSEKLNFKKKQIWNGHKIEKGGKRDFV